MSSQRRIVSMLLLMVMLVGLISGCAPTHDKLLDSIDDLKDATIGVVTGSSWDLVIKEKLPEAKRLYFQSASDVLLALKQGRIDAFFADKTIYAAMRWENADITYIDEPIETISNALIFPKEDYDPQLVDEINEFIAEAGESGTLDALSDKWFGNSEPTEHPDYTTLTGENGTIKVAVGDSMKPNAYKSGLLYTGYEMDFLTMFAEEYGYSLDVSGMTFDAIIPTVSTGKCDIGACGFTITPERAESVMFSDSHFETCGVAVIRSSSSATTEAITSFDDIANGKIAIMTGTVWDDVAMEDFPGAERLYFTSVSDMFLALGQGKVDAVFGDRTFYTSARWENVPADVLDEPIGAISCGFMLPKENYNEVLLAQLNEFIAAAKADGTSKRLYDKWFASEEPTEHPDYKSLTGENGTLKIAIDNTTKPMTYQKVDCYSGHDVDLLTEFARRYGYRIEFEGMSFDALIPAVTNGKFDIAACSTAITEERAESVTFTDPYIEVDGVAIINKTDLVEQSGFFEGIIESFEKTFIREQRWKLILEGVGVTLLISLSAIVFGTLLGIGLYMLSRTDILWLATVVKKIAKVYSRIVAGTPVLVILMIFYYIIFGGIRDMSGILVAIICFSLTFGAFIYNHMAISVGNVDYGQTEAAYALGYTKNMTFFRIIFPQAMKIFMPSFTNQAVELVKATAIVGYIAINDLTKIGDIIRSNTYEPFFPLFATAVIYFTITWLLSLGLGQIKLLFEAKRRKSQDVLKGVETV